MIAVKMAIWLALGAVVVGGVMLLWNWLLPGLFTGARTIDYWQTLGLIVLCRILFGGGGRGWKGRRHHRRWHQRSHDEREQFRQRFQGRCGKAEQAEEAAP